MGRSKTGFDKKGEGEGFGSTVPRLFNSIKGERKDCLKKVRGKVGGITHGTKVK